MADIVDFIQITIVYKPINCQLVNESMYFLNYYENYILGGYKVSEGITVMLNFLLN